MKKLCLLLVLLLAGCGHSTGYNSITHRPDPVSYETLAQIHRGLEQAAFHRRFILIEGERE